LDCEYKYNNQLQLTRLKPYGKAETIYTWNGIYLTSKTIGNQIWHYTYIPYVGISSITNPLGITTYYSYNTNGKLVEEYRMNNGKKEILNYYHYHISSEQ
jgi:YD repeat-containing protein